MKNQYQKSLGVLLCLALFAADSFAFGIDKLAANLDVGANFKSVASFLIFNDDSDKAAYVTAEGLSWEMNEGGQMTTKPSEDIQIFPSVIRIPAGGSATFKVRYTGSPPSGEANYRVLFKETVIPTVAQDSKEVKLSELINNTTSVGMAITVPLYVTDFTQKTDVLDHVSALFTSSDKSTQLIIDNGGDRHITITDYRINGKDSGKGLGIVLANLKRPFTLDALAPGASVDVKISYKEQSKWISAVERQ